MPPQLVSAQLERINQVDVAILRQGILFSFFPQIVFPRPASIAALHPANAILRRESLESFFGQVSPANLAYHNIHFCTRERSDGSSYILLRGTGLFFIFLVFLFPHLMPRLSIGQHLHPCRWNRNCSIRIHQRHGSHCC